MTAATIAGPRRLVQAHRVRGHAARAIAERLKYHEPTAIISCGRDPDVPGAVLLHVNSGGNAIAASDALRAAGYRADGTGYDPFAPGHYGVQLRVCARTDPATAPQGAEPCAT